MASFSGSVYQTFFYLFSAFAAAEDFDDQVDHITGFDQTFLNFFFLLFFVQEGGVFSIVYIKDKVYVVFNYLFQAEGFRSAVCDCQHIDTESIFQFGFFVEHVCEIFHVCISFQVKDNADSFFG